MLVTAVLTLQRRQAMRFVRTDRRHAARGFTLVELGVVVALVAIVASIATPSFKSLIDSMDAKNASMELVTDLSAARSEALKRNAAVSLAPTTDADWSRGWQITTGGTLLGERSALRPGLSLLAPPAGVTFLPNGRLSDSDLASGNASWSITSTNPAVSSRCVVITPTGSARSKVGSC